MTVNNSHGGGGTEVVLDFMMSPKDVAPFVGNGDRKSRRRYGESFEFAVIYAAATGRWLAEAMLWDRQRPNSDLRKHEQIHSDATLCVLFGVQLWLLFTIWRMRRPDQGVRLAACLSYGCLEFTRWSSEGVWRNMAETTPQLLQTLHTMTIPVLVEAILAIIQPEPCIHTENDVLISFGWHACALFMSFSFPGRLMFESHFKFQGIVFWCYIALLLLESLRLCQQSARARWILRILSPLVLFPVSCLFTGLIGDKGVGLVHLFVLSLVLVQWIRFFKFCDEPFVPERVSPEPDSRFQHIRQLSVPLIIVVGVVIGYE